MKAKVLLVKLDKPSGGASRLSCSEPIGICYIAAWLQAHGIGCRLAHVFDAPVEGSVRKHISEYRPDIVGFSVRNFNFEASRSCITMLRREFPTIRVALGGECITEGNAADLGQKSNADLLVIGDGETSFLAYASGSAPHRIPGVAYRTDAGTYRLSGKPTHCIALPDLPMMVRDDLPMHRYSTEAFPGKRYATIHAQRGCRYRCTFCHTANRYNQPASRTVQQILDEIDFLIAEYSIEALAIWDEDFFAHPGRAEAIARGLIDRGSPVAWQTFMKLTDLRKRAVRDLLPVLRRAGYIRAVIGLESFLPETLRRYQKAGGPDFEGLCLRLTENDILLCPAYIIGAPHETCDDIQYGLDRLRRLHYDHGVLMDLPYVAFITPFPGTGVFEEYSRNGLILDDDWSHYDGEHVVVKSECPPKTLLELRNAFYAQFYGTSVQER